MSMVIVGTLVNKHLNFMAVGWVTSVNFRPPMIAIALAKSTTQIAGFIPLGLSASMSQVLTSWRRWTTAESYQAEKKINHHYLK
jgi:hypothetical protein